MTEGDRTGRTYERLAEQVFTELGTLNGAETVELARNKFVQGKATRHEIDIWWRFRVDGVVFTYAFQCKDEASAIKQGDMLTFSAVLDDLVDLGVRGVFVTRTGFQAGARRVAAAQGIKAYEMRSPTERDWKGRVREIHLNLTMAVPSFRNYRIQVADEANVPPELDAMTNEVLFEDTDGSTLLTMQDVHQRVLWPDFDEHDWEQRTFVFPTPTWIRTASGRAEVVALGVDASVTTRTQTFVISGSDLVVLLLEDVLTGGRIMYRKP